MHIIIKCGVTDTIITFMDIRIDISVLKYMIYIYIYIYHSDEA